VRSWNYCCRGKATSIRYKVVQIWPGQTVTCLHTNSPGHIWTTLYFSVSVCVWARVAVLIQYETRMRLILLSSAASLSPSHFCELSHKRHDYPKKLLKVKRVVWLSVQLLFETFLITRWFQPNIAINVKRLHVTYPLFLPDFNETWIFWTYFQQKKKKAQI
jgi:hypothetical protein